MSYVVDTSVFLRWWVEQIGWQHAQRVRDRFLAGEIALLTPEFTRVEHAEVLRKKALLDGVLDEDEYLAAVESLDVLGVELVPLDRHDLVRAPPHSEPSGIFGCSTRLEHRSLWTAAFRSSQATPVPLARWPG